MRAKETTEILVTNVSADELPYDIIQEMYHLRWGVETHFDVVKNRCEIANFSGILPPAILQEHHATVLLSNMCTLVEAEAHPGVRLPSLEQLEQWQAESEDIRGLWGISPDYFLFVSAVSPRKNVRRLLEAFSQVNELMPNTTLVLAGPTTPEISAIIQHMGTVGKSVFTLGYVDELNLHRLYANARSVVYPSLYEGFGLPALEATAPLSLHPTRRRSLK